MSSRSWTRRSFLRASLVGASALAGGLAIPDRLVAATLPEGNLSLYNIHTGERLHVRYRDASGRYEPDALHALDRVLRCHVTGETVPIDPGVIEFLNLVDKTLGGAHEIHVISGFRSAAYNDWLIRHGHGVARHSLHLVGKAIDIRIPTIDLETLRRTALDLGRGGVGYYPQSDFVHLDSGRVRTW